MRQAHADPRPRLGAGLGIAFRMGALVRQAFEGIQRAMGLTERRARHVVLVLVLRHVRGALILRKEWAGLVVPHASAALCRERDTVAGEVAIDAVRDAACRVPRVGVSV